MRVGLGYDSHRFDSARELVLGGVSIPDHPGLAGHSDGDAVLHAVTDALLGAAGLGSIGEHFPDSDPDLANADSATLLERTVSLIEAENYQVVNADVTVITETPRILDQAPEIRKRLAELLHVSPGAVSAKGKTNEGMGFIGRGEGLAVMAVALIDRIRDTDALHASLRTG